MLPKSYTNWTLSENPHIIRHIYIYIKPVAAVVEKEYKKHSSAPVNKFQRGPRGRPSSQREPSTQVFLWNVRLRPASALRHHHHIHLSSSLLPFSGAQPRPSARRLTYDDPQSAHVLSSPKSVKIHNSPNRLLLLPSVGRRPAVTLLSSSSRCRIGRACFRRDMEPGTRTATMRNWKSLFVLLWLKQTKLFFSSSSYCTLLAMHQIFHHTLRLWTVNKTTAAG